MSRVSEDFAPYLARLRELPFVRGAKVQPSSDLAHDARIVLRTPEGEYALVARLFKSNITPQLADRAIYTAHHSKPRRDRWIVLAPAVGQSIAERFDDAGIAFVDRLGNCSLTLDGRYVARIERRAPRALART